MNPALAADILVLDAVPHGAEHVQWDPYPPFVEADLAAAAADLAAADLAAAAAAAGRGPPPHRLDILGGGAVFAATCRLGRWVRSRLHTVD